MSTFKSGNSPGASPLRFGALALACGCFAFSGCPVDDRSLAQSIAGAAGSSGAGMGAMSAGGARGSGVGGTHSPGAGEGGAPSGRAGADHSGQAGAPEPVGDGCEDLDEDGVRDCEQTVAQNSRFMTDAAGWESEPTLHQSWEPRDASNVPESGALLVRNTNTAQGVGTMLSGSRQCIAVIGQESYSVAVNTFIPNGQGEGSAGLNVWFFGSDQCEANSIGTLPVQLVSETGVWSVVRGKFSAPGGARSMHVRLVTSKPFEQPSMEALFDDVLVRHE